MYKYQLGGEEGRGATMRLLGISPDGFFILVFKVVPLFSYCLVVLVSAELYLLDK
jgi:hypothetical protein